MLKDVAIHVTLKADARECVQGNKCYIACFKAELQQSSTE